MDLVQLSNRFQSELDAVKYFEAKRWKGSIRCPYCNSDKHGNRNKDFRFHCGCCHKSYSVTTRTWLHNTKIPLRTWMMAITLITNAKKGISALQLQRDLHVNYRTAWRICMKLRQRTMKDDSPAKLDDVVEVDETYVGGAPRTWTHPDKLDYNEQAKYDKQLDDLRQKGIDVKQTDAYKKRYDVDVKRGRGTNKTAVVGLVERDGRVIAEVMKTLTYANLEAMVRRNIKVDETVVITDKYKGYHKFNEVFNHIVIDHKRMYSYKGIHTNTIESFWAIIKRGIIGQYHQVSLKYLPDYIVEFVYKYNNRNKGENTMFNEITKKAIETQT